ncbi:zeta toxin family protein [Variovorax saccharolyticus]|uniref:zeta toxin family protein n=1 Tax=Variovorax saccharolyticus TaxID=3053516 RepID=UPI002576A7EB|nr:zeta toxin family protein [Variovorax sp. J22R187]MDM0022676.1 zeta toxin family protein [Variovorax sp. J22R187]
MTQGLRLSASERDHLYECRVRPDLFAGVAASTAPVAMFVAGQPGAGVPVAAALLRRELRKTAGPAIHVSPSRLAAYHPANRASAGFEIPGIQPDILHWLGRAVDDTRQQRVHAVIEDELEDAQSMPRMAFALRKDAYTVQAVFVSTLPELSRLRLAALYDRRRSCGLPTPFVSALAHDAALANVRLVLGQLEDRRAVDGLRIIDAQCAQFYENRLTAGGWARTARARAALDMERVRSRSPKDLVQTAMRWETLVRRLVQDAAVPRDVASEVLRWRDQAVAQCEALPAAAQMLQWAREAAAFRTMERNEFEREFPHHARAVQSLGLAMRESEKYQEYEAMGLVLHARENIAQRIERGDMARIAARERQTDPPSH